MDTGRFRRLRRMFDTAVELDGSARREYVARECGGDDDLRRDLEGLLAEDAGASGSIDGVIHDAVLALPGQSPDGRSASVVQIGDYPIIREIAQGGMGVVYLAWDTRLKRHVALKVLPPEFRRDGSSLARFHQEAQLLAAVNHPNIATVYSLEHDEDTHFLTMEFIDGENLGSRLAGEPLGIPEALSLCRQVATALEVAHKSGVIHRDLKPLNVMVTSDDFVKVLDFGLAKSVDSTTDITSKDAVAGTPGYMSPEQLRGSKVDYATDVWSFGCILYECLSGKPAFPGATSSDRLAATLHDEVDWSALPTETAEAIRGLLAWCLVKDSSDRLGDMAEVRRILDGEIGMSEVFRSVAPRQRDRPRTNNLPMSLSSFVGRGDTIKALRRLINVNRLVTLTGPGGSGKTRLSMEVGRQLIPDFADGVWLVELAPLSDADAALVPQEVGLVFGVGERTGPLMQGLIDHLSARRLLLILDNCEHLLDACAELSRKILERCPDVHIVATSREKLGIGGEINFHVPTLELPPRIPIPLEEFSEIEAVRLFVERANAEGGSFQLTQEDQPVVADICRQLDGIPLALELASARMRVLSVGEIASRLKDRFQLLTGGSKTAMPQHQTLRALIDWSYDLLTPMEKTLFWRVSVFAGGWTLEAAEKICSDDGLDEREILDLHSNLIDKSLLEVDTKSCKSCGQARYRMLATIRSYALDRLREAGEDERIRRRQRDYFIDLAEETWSELRGADHMTWLARWRSEDENFRAALDECARDPDPRPGLRLAGALGQYWEVCSHFSEGRAALARALSQPNAPAPTPARARALEWAGRLAYRQSDYREAERRLQESLRIRRDQSDDEGIAEVLGHLGSLAKVMGFPDRALDLYEQALATFRILGREERVATILCGLASLAIRQAAYGRARSYLEESLDLGRRINSADVVIESMKDLAGLAMHEEKHEEARELLEESLDLARDLGDRHAIATVLHDLARLNQETGNHEESRSLQSLSLRIRWEMGDRYCMSRSLSALGILAAQTGDPVRCVRLFGATEGLLTSIRASLGPVHEAEREECLKQVRGTMAEDAFKGEWEKGAEMPIGEVVEYAAQEGAERIP